MINIAGRLSKAMRYKDITPEKLVNIGKKNTNVFLSLSHEKFRKIMKGNGYPKYHELYIIAEVLGVPETWLLGVGKETVEEVSKDVIIGKRRVRELVSNFGERVFGMLDEIQGVISDDLLTYKELEDFIEDEMFPEHDILMEIAYLLDVSPIYLLGYDVDPESDIDFISGDNVDYFPEYNLENKKQKRVVVEKMTDLKKRILQAMTHKKLSYSDMSQNYRRLAHIFNISDNYDEPKYFNFGHENFVKRYIEETKFIQISEKYYVKLSIMLGVSVEYLKGKENLDVAIKNFDKKLEELTNASQKNMNLKLLKSTSEEEEADITEDDNSSLYVPTKEVISKKEMFEYFYKMLRDDTGVIKLDLKHKIEESGNVNETLQAVEEYRHRANESERMLEALKYYMQ